jgi:UV DNA damage repair endonuclease
MEKKKGKVENLKPRPFNSESGREAGIKSGESRKAQKEGRELVRDIITRNAGNLPEMQPLIKRLKEIGYCEHDCNIEMLMHLGQMIKAVSEGDTKAYMAIMKMLGHDIEQLKVTTDEPIVIKFGE